MDTLTSYCVTERPESSLSPRYVTGSAQQVTHTQHQWLSSRDGLVSVHVPYCLYAGETPHLHSCASPGLQF